MPRAPKNTPESCSVQEAAKWVGCSRPTLVAWLKEMEIPTNQRLNVGEFVRARLKWEYERGKAVAGAAGEEAIEKIQEAIGEHISEDEAKRRIAIAKMIQEEIKAEKAQGDTASISEMRDEYRAECMRLRAELLDLPAKLASRAVGDENRRREVIEGEIHAALSKLSDGEAYEPRPDS